MGKTLKNREIFCDKTEIVLLVSTKNRVISLNVPYDQIIHIKIDKCMERKLLKKVPSEKIEIMIKKRPEPIIYTKYKSAEYFDEYKNDISRFVKENKITFFNNI